MKTKKRAYISLRENLTFKDIMLGIFIESFFNLFIPTLATAFFLITGRWIFLIFWLVPMLLKFSYDYNEKNFRFYLIK